MKSTEERRKWWNEKADDFDSMNMSLPERIGALHKAFPFAVEAIRDEQRKCCWKRYMAIDRPILPEAKERAIADAILNAGKM